MSTLRDKYANVIRAAESAGIRNLQVTEQDGILYIAGDADSTFGKDAVWDALGVIDPSFTATDVNINVQVTGLVAGTTLEVVTEQSNLNIRQEPSTEATIVGKAAKGEKVTLVEQFSAEWWEIKTAQGEEGYAYARYLRA